MSDNAVFSRAHKSSETALSKNNVSETALSTIKPSSSSKNLRPSYTPTISSSNLGNMLIKLPDATPTISHTPQLNVPEMKIKRPSTVLEEDEYFDALTTIITRDYFPAAEDLQDKIDKLDDEMSGSATENMQNEIISESSSIDTSLGLDQFQAKYTSEDNNSFNDLLEKQNNDKRKKYAWMWSSNRIVGTRGRVAKSLEAQKALHLLTDSSAAETEHRAKEIGWVDSRPKGPDSWEFEVKNSFMFQPGGYESGLHAKNINNQASKQIVPQSTRLIDADNTGNFHSRPRKLTSDNTTTDFEGKPLVNGFSFVTENTFLSTAPSNAKFDIADVPKREQLHFDVLQRKKKLRQEEKLAGIKGPKSKVLKTPGTRGSVTSTPLTPAASRLLGNMTGGRRW